MTPVLGVVVGDVAFIVLVLLACLFILGVGIFAISFLGRVSRCRTCQRWMSKGATPGDQALCQACREATIRTEETPALHGALAHDLLEHSRRRHHETVHNETSP